MHKDRFKKTINIKNRQAHYQYELLERFTAGLVLKGTEIKSIREGQVRLQEGYCYFYDNELFIKGMSITPYTNATYYNHEADRERKLLLRKQELKKLMSQSEEKGLTIVPVRIFINDRGYAKLEIALSRGKKSYDKRESIKKRDVERQLSRLNYKVR